MPVRLWCRVDSVARNRRNDLSVTYSIGTASVCETLYKIEPESNIIMRPKKILVACECSGRVRDAFLDLGHDAYSCDLQPSDSDRGKSRHFQQNVCELLSSREWDLIIAHPSCTYLCNSGVCWLHTRPGRWAAMESAAQFFLKCLAANASSICVENPIPHKYAMEIIKQPYSQIIQPWQYGHGETKATCLWLHNLPLLQPTNIVPGREQRIHRLPLGPNRSKLRSVTYQGIASAMAEQWGAYIMESGSTSYNSPIPFASPMSEAATA